MEFELKLKKLSFLKLACILPFVIFPPKSHPGKNPQRRAREGAAALAVKVLTGLGEAIRGESDSSW